jgi:hypothetical protein
MLSQDSEFDLPESIKEHVQKFAEIAAVDIPDKAMFKEMGMTNMEPIKVFNQFKKSFKVRLADI